MLWVNGTNIVNGSTVTYTNGSMLMLSATPTNANYSFTSMNLNGTETTDNPASYNLTVVGVEPFNASVSVLFTAEAIPTPSPTPEYSGEDAAGLAVIALFVAVCVSAGLVVAFRQKPEQ